MPSAGAKLANLLVAALLLLSAPLRAESAIAKSARDFSLRRYEHGADATDTERAKRDLLSILPLGTPVGEYEAFFRRRALRALLESLGTR